MYGTFIVKDGKTNLTERWQKKMGKKQATEKRGTGQKEVVISPARFETAMFEIVGDAPYVQHAFSQKAQEVIIGTQQAGSTARSVRKRDPKNFDECYEGSLHKTASAKYGIPAGAFRSAMIDACRVAGFKMTHAKCSIFIIADDYDVEEGTPLVLITKGQPQKHIGPVRNKTGVLDFRARAMWKPGWEAKLRIKYDADQFTTQDIANLLCRAGLQIGIGEGRPFSKESNGCGWGTFVIKEDGK